MFKTLTAGLAVAAALALAPAAQAHPHVNSGSPAPGATVSASPTELRIVFSEGVFPKFSGIVLTNQAGAVVKTGPARVDADNKVLIVPVLAKLPPGAYTVAWHAVSTDTHRVKGTYSFKVAG
jgi:methionine-rich copper-binding protein CopC